MNLSSFREVRDREAVEKNGSVGGARPRVLIVDDDHPSVQTVYDMAKSFKSQVDAANGVEAAIDCLKKSRYDAVIADLELNGLSGYELARWIRGKSPDTGVIIMTGLNHAEIEQYMNTGIVDHWIFKPFGINDLEIALDGFVPRGLVDSPGAS